MTPTPSDFSINHRSASGHLTPCIRLRKRNKLANDISFVSGLGLPGGMSEGNFPAGECPAQRVIVAAVSCQHLLFADDWHWQYHWTPMSPWLFVSHSTASAFYRPLDCSSTDFVFSSIVASLIIFRLDYCNGILSFVLQRFQQVTNVNTWWCFLCWSSFTTRTIGFSYTAAPLSWTVLFPRWHGPKLALSFTWSEPTQLADPTLPTAKYKIMSRPVAEVWNYNNFKSVIVFFLINK